MRLRMRVSAVSESPPRSLPQALCFVTMKPGRRLVGGWTPDTSSIFRPGVQAEHGYANGYVSGSETRLIGLFHGSRRITGEPLVPLGGLPPCGRFRLAAVSGAALGGRASSARRWPPAGLSPAPGASALWSPR